MERITALEPKIARVRMPVRVDEGEVVLTCDGAAIEPFEPGTAAIDPGKHTCRADAGSKTKWRGPLVLDEGETRTLDLTAPYASATLTPREPAPSSTPPKDKDSPTPSPPPERSNATTIAGWALLGVGAVSLGASGFFAVQAKSKDDDAAAHCDARGCDPQGVVLGDDAQSAGNVATVFGIAGLALAAGGAVMLFVLRPLSPTARAPRAPGTIFRF
jgi:hypothetical protein